MSELSDKRFSKLAGLADEIGVSRNLIPFIQTSLAGLDLAQDRLQDGVADGLSYLDSLRDCLEPLLSSGDVKKQIRLQAKLVIAAIDGSDGISPDQIPAHLGRLEAEACGSPAYARVLEAGALFHRLRMDYSAAAIKYGKAADLDGRSDAERWFCAYQQVVALRKLGLNSGDQAMLEKCVDRLRSQVVPLSKSLPRIEMEISSHQALGEVLAILGQRHQGTRYLEEAVSAFREAVALSGLDRYRVEWAKAQNGLGNALGLLGRRLADLGLLKESVKTFELLIGAIDERSDSQQWALAMSSLGTALQLIGRKEGDSSVLKRSSESYKQALRVWTKKEFPQYWAMTMDNLGTVLRLLGEQRRGARTLQQAVAAYKSALTEFSRDRFPQQWATTKNNLGAALQKLASREDDPKMMQDAITSYECALEECGKESVPITWAMSIANLGVSRCEFAAMTENSSEASKAVLEIQAAVDVFREASHAQYTELGEEKLALARKLLEDLKSLDGDESETAANE